MEDNVHSFVKVIQGQFSGETQPFINENTDITKLKEWSSLQTMILVNEIDKNFGVILGVQDFESSKSITDLFAIVQQKKQA